MKRSFLLLAAFILVTAACNQSTIPEKSDILGLASPITLNYDTTEIVMEDFFMNPSGIDSISLDNGLKYEVEGDYEKVIITGEPTQKLTLFTVWMQGDRYDILIRKSEKELVKLTYTPERTVRKVQLKGQMNGWNPSATTLEKVGDSYETQMLMNPGLYEYLFVVDGKEIQDPRNPVTIPNGIGGINSLLTVGDVDASTKPTLMTKEEDGSKITFEAVNAERTYVFWQNTALAMAEGSRDIEVNLPIEARGMKRSFVRALAHNENGFSNDVLIPIEYGKVVTSSTKLGRKDFQAWNMYMILIDRFKDGNPDNTRKVDDPDIDPRVNYYGGDFAGITQTIESGYFNDLGINALWLSPITQNPETAYGFWDQGGVETKFSGYHGYWPISSSKLDDRYGTEEEFKKLIDVAHENGIAVIIDYVANHVHEEHPVYQANKDWATDLYLPDGTENTQKWDEYRLTTWFDTFMPSLDFSKPEVVDTMTDSALFWLENYELDGFRHDATKHIQLAFWRSLTRKVKENVVSQHGQPIYQVGETYGSRELISSYINSGMLDSQFDFSLFDAAQNAFGGDQDFDYLVDQTNESLKYYGNHNVMGYISGNHDKARFISLTSGEVRWDEDPKKAAWTREIADPKAVAYNKLKLLFAWNMTIPGIPVTYYGDEFGMPGAGDPDNRRWMVFEDEQLNEYQKENKNITRKLMQLRNSEMSLLYGDFQFHLVEGDQLVYSRAYFEEQAITILNKSDEEATIEVELREGYNYEEIKNQFGNDFEIEEGVLKITLPANTFEILTI